MLRSSTRFRAAVRWPWCCASSRVRCDTLRVAARLGCDAWLAVCGGGVVVGVWLLWRQHVVSLIRACVVGVWHCGVDAGNPALGTTGVQTLLDALPAATMKVVYVGGAYGHITTPVSTHARSRGVLCVPRMALVVTCMSHGLAHRVRWFGCVYALLVRGTWQAVASKAGCRLARRHGVPWRCGSVTVRCSSRGDTNSVFVCALLHVHAVALATGNRNWGALGAESVANLLHHAPVLQKVVLSGTVACTHRCHLFGLHTHLPCPMPCV